MQLIYTDESGTGEVKNQPVLLIAALIADKDKHVTAAAAALNDAFSHIPERYRNGFLFHAKDLVHSERIRDGWDRAGRMELLETVMAIPRNLGIPISIAMEKKGDGNFVVPFQRNDLSHEETRHAKLFATALCCADVFVREHHPDTETASVIAEDLPERRYMLQRAEREARMRGGYLKIGPNGRHLPVALKRIPGPVRFEKKGAPLLQIVDAVAYGLRRYFENRADGRQLAENILGSEGFAKLDFNSSGRQSLFGTETWETRPMSPFAGPFFGLAPLSLMMNQMGSK